MYSVGPTISFSFSVSGLILRASMYMGGGLGCEIVIVSFFSVRVLGIYSSLLFPSQLSFGCILVSFRVGAVVAFLAFKVFFFFFF